MLPYINGRGVEHLVHFTRIENVRSILESGLVGRTDLDAAGINYTPNDCHRFDYQPNATCLSISFPNYKMFYRLRMENPELDWAVIRLSPEIVKDKRCAFAYVNAATREIAHSDIEVRMQKPALESMFADHDGMPMRNTLNIPDSYTTNPQAEVLCLDGIEPQYIRDVVFDAKDRVKNQPLVRALARDHNAIAKFQYGPSLFMPRRDHAHWKGR